MKIWNTARRWFAQAGTDSGVVHYTPDEFLAKIGGLKMRDFKALPPEIARRVPGFYAACRLLSGSLMTTEWIVKGATPAENARQRRQSRLQYLFNVEPHPRWSGPEMKRRIMTDILERGDAFVRVLRDNAQRVAGFRPLLADHVRVEGAKDGTGTLAYYELPAGELVPASDMLHFTSMFYNGETSPSALNTGPGTGASALRSTQSFLATLYKNGALQTVVVTVDKGTDVTKWTNEQKEQFRKQWTKRAAGIDNTGKPVILQPGMSVEKLSMTPENLQYVEAANFQIAEIGRATGIPSALLNQEQKNTSLASAVSELTAGYLKYGLAPHIVMVEAELNRKLAPDNGDWRIEVDLTQLTRLSPKDRYEQHSIGIAGGFLTPNEAREKEDLPPLPGGDSLQTRAVAAAGMQSEPEEDEDDDEG